MIPLLLLHAKQDTLSLNPFNLLHNWHWALKESSFSLKDSPEASHISFLMWRMGAPLFNWHPDTPFHYPSSFKGVPPPSIIITSDLIPSIWVEFTSFVFSSFHSPHFFTHPATMPCWIGAVTNTFCIKPLLVGALNLNSRSSNLSDKWPIPNPCLHISIHLPSMIVMHSFKWAPRDGGAF